MGSGLALPLLLAAKQAFGTGYFGEKITPPGYMQYLSANTKPNLINSGIDDGSGYIRNVQIRYMPRTTLGQSSDVDDCALQSTPGYKTMTIPTTLFRKTSILLEDAMISAFQKDALALQTIGTPPTSITTEMMDMILNRANGLIGDIDTALLSLQAANFGKNAVTGSAAAKAINFALSGVNNPLNNGMTEVLSDTMLNEIMAPNTKIVGSGLINNYYLQQPAKGDDQSGLNTSQLYKPDFYWDPYSQSAWGTNKFAMLEKNAVQLINICRFRGFKAGVRGDSEFGTVILPLTDSLGKAIGAWEFDWQKRFITCPENVFLDGSTTPTSVGRGTVLDLMCSFTQVNIPADAYQASDLLFGVNGTLLYSATNS